MSNRKKEEYKPKPMTDRKRNINQRLLQEYDIETADNIQDALKDLLSGTIQEMLEAEMVIILVMPSMNVLLKTILGMEQRANVSVVNTASLKWMFLRTGKAPLSHEFYPNVRKIFQKLRTKSFPCMLKE